MRRRLLAAVLAAGALMALPAAAQAASNTLVINEIDYDQPSTDTAEYLEIRNNSSAAVNLDAFALKFVNGANNLTYLDVDLPSLSLAAGGYYVVCGDPLNVPGCDQDVGVNSNLIQNGPQDAVALMNGEAIVDSLSYAGVLAGFTEGGTGAPTDTAAAPPAPAQSISRIPDGCDTDRNGADFVLVSATPDASNGAGACVEPAPTLASSDPAANEIRVDPDAAITVTFSEPVTAGAGAFSLECGDDSTFALTASSADQTSFTLDPDGSLPVGEGCTLTVHGAAISDVDEIDPADTMAGDATVTFFITGLEGLRIHDIQGAAHISPFDGNSVEGVPGVVTAVRNDGFWMQDASPDGDSATSEGIFVHTGAAPSATVGNAVTVAGVVAELRPPRVGTPNTDNLTVTEIRHAIVSPAGAGAAIAPTVVGTGGRVPPGQVIEDDASGNVETSGIFDFADDGIDFYESLENMKLQVNDAVAVGPTNGFGEVFVVGDEGANAGVRTSRGGVVISPGDFNPERIQLDDVIGDTPSVNVGDRFPGAIVGVLSYDFGNFELLPLEDVAAVSGGLKPEETVAPRGGELSVATFNVENLDPSDTETMPRLARLVVENMLAPDLIAIEEMQDNSGGDNDGTTAADESWQAFIDAIDKIAPALDYKYRQIDPVNNADGGQPGGNIRVGFLFRTDRGLSFLDRGAGDATTPTGVFRSQGQAHLTHSPGRVDPLNEAWVATRKPLAGEFTWKGATLIAIANHFSSKGGDDPLFGRWQPPVRSTEVARHKQAASVNAFVDDILAVEKSANVVVLGDINDFEFSETTQILEGGVLSSLLHQLPKPERYSYVFEGNSQVLDQILASEGAIKALRGFDAVHVNAEFADQASDHDPSVARFELKERGD